VYGSALVLVALCLAGVCFAGAGARAAGWETPRGNAHATGVAQGPGPVDPVIAWQERWRGGAFAPPVAADGTVFMARDAVGGSAVTALDLTSGDTEWEHRIGAPVCGLSVADGVVYAVSEPGALVLLDAQTGRVRGEFTAPGNLPPPGSPWAPVPLVGADVVVPLRDAVLALRAGVTEPLWTWSRPPSEPAQHWLTGPVSVTRGGHVLVSTSSGCLFALSGIDGSVQWRFQAGGEGIPVAAAVDSRDHVYSVASPQAFRGILACVDAPTGRALWLRDLPRHAWVPPAATDEAVVVLDMDGRLSCFGAGTGEPQWETTLPSGEGPRGLPSAPVIDSEGRVYAAMGQTTLCCGLDNGEELFRREMDEGICIEHVILPGGGSLLVTFQDGTICCLRDPEADG